MLTLVKGRRDHFRFLMEGLARSHEPPGELVVVNMDAEPLQVARQDFPVRIMHAPSGTQLPLAAARNRAAAVAQHRLLMFLDIDCVVSAGTIGRLHHELVAQDAMLAPQVLYLKRGDIGPDWKEEVLRRRGSPHPVRCFPRHGLRVEPNPGFLWGVAFGMRAASFYRLGGFDEQFTGYGAEDTDFGFRCDRAGMKLVYQSGAPVFHQHHQLSAPPLQHFADIVRNAALFHARWGIWPMQERLDAFAAMGLLQRGPAHLHILRYPTPSEILAARQPDSVIF